MYCTTFRIAPHPCTSDKDSKKCYEEISVGPTPPPGCRDEGLLAQKARGVRGAVRTDGVADHSSDGDVVVIRSGI